MDIKKFLVRNKRLPKKKHYIITCHPENGKYYEYEIWSNEIDALDFINETFTNIVNIAVYEE